VPLADREIVNVHPALFPCHVCYVANTMTSQNVAAVAVAAAAAAAAQEARRWACMQ